VHTYEHIAKQGVLRLEGVAEALAPLNAYLRALVLYLLLDGVFQDCAARRDIQYPHPYAVFSSPSAQDTHSEVSYLPLLQTR